MADKHPQWLKNISRKRGGEMLTLVIHLVNCGIRNGRVTAEDAHCIPVSHPNCRGAAMKYLHRFGFVKAMPTTGKTQQSHGHHLFVWELRDRLTAQAALRLMQMEALRIVPAPSQMELSI